MPKLIDLIGQKFGRLTVIERDYSKKNGTYWLCQCECGNQKIVESRNLRRGLTKSCGCLQKERASEVSLIDLTGRNFGRLTVLKRDIKNTKNGAVLWVCQCECGNIISATGNHLNQGHTQSCGCLQKERTSEALLKNLTGQKFGKLTVLERDIDKRNKEKVYWKCQCDCGNIISVEGGQLKSGKTMSCGCLVSKGEYYIGNILNKMGLNYKKQYTFSDLKGKNKPLRFDFAVFEGKKLRYLIEYQGRQHYEPIEDFGGEENFNIQKSYDEKKRHYCEENNIKLIEIPYWDFNKIDEIYISNKINK